MPTTEAHTNTVKVTITADGFSPREVTLDTSSLVMFVNQDTSPHWPASNPHPHHNIYPEFDPTAAIAPGQWWLFQPQQAGTWHYHDHLNPHRKGTIIAISEVALATPTAAPSPQIPVPQKQPFFTRLAHTFTPFWQSVGTRFWRLMPTKKSTMLPAAAFRQLPEKQQYDELEKIAKTIGVAKTWQYVKDAFAATDTPGGGQAHNTAHFLGSLIYTQEGLTGLSICDPTFAFGCYHGFTEGAFEKNLDLLIPVTKACEKLGPVSSGPWSSCVHGIGHGIASYYNSTDLSLALTTCDKLQQGATFCHDGVFMEFSISAPASFYKSDNPLYPCNTLSAEYQTACGRNIITAAGKRFNLPPLEIAKVCLRAKAPFTTSCIDTFGFMAASADQKDGIKITTRCQDLEDSAAIGQCAAAAAGELIFQNYPDWQTQAPRVCQALPSGDKSACFTRLNQTIANYNR